MTTVTGFDPGPVLSAAAARLDADIRAGEAGLLRMDIALGRDGVAHLMLQVADEAARQALLDRRDQLAANLADLGLQLSLEVGTRAQHDASGSMDASGFGADPDGLDDHVADSPRAWSAQAWAASAGLGMTAGDSTHGRLHIYA
jgi:hypothetical protein